MDDLSTEELKIAREFLDQIRNSDWMPKFDDSPHIYLAPLKEHVSQLTALSIDKQLADGEHNELAAIRSSEQSNDFYFMMYYTLDNAITGCQSLASGLVGESSTSSFRSWCSSMIKEGVWESLKEVPSFQKIVTGAIKWASKQFPLPFADFTATLFQVLSSVKEERDKYIALVNVAAFGVAAKHSSGGLHLTVSRICRYVLRSGKYTGQRPDFAAWQVWAARLLADPAISRAKAEGKLAAELVLEVIMKPPPTWPPLSSVSDGDELCDMVASALDIDLSTLSPINPNDSGARGVPERSSTTPVPVAVITPPFHLNHRLLVTKNQSKLDSSKWPTKSSNSRQSSIEKNLVQLRRKNRKNRMWKSMLAMVKFKPKCDVPLKKFTSIDSRGWKQL